jgi:hypothetical protein
MKNYGKVITDANGRRVPLTASPRTKKSMAAATHRPLSTGPNIHCPYCKEAFPNPAAVAASKAPTTRAKKDKFQLTHCGMRFGTPPLFNFPVSALVLCILHTLLRMSAILFQRTIVVNLDTKEKVKAVNDIIKFLHLGCKKLELRKTSGARRNDHFSIVFTGA